MKNMFNKFKLSSDTLGFFGFVIGWFILMFIFDFSDKGSLVAKEISNALNYLFASWVVYMIYIKSKEHTLEKTFWSTLRNGALWCGGFALLTAFWLGDPSCEDYEQDNRGGTCYEYADDGFTPTLEQRLAQFAFYLTILYIPVIIGATNGKKEKVI